MAGSLNKCQFIGNLGKDPEVRHLNNGDQVVSFSIACSESWRDKNSGERKEKTDWVNIVVFNEGIGRIVEQYCKKGSKVYVEGSMQTRMWEKEGVKHYTTEVVLQKFRGELVLLGDRGERGASEGDGGGERRSSGEAGAGPRMSSRSARPLADDISDEIPFMCEWR